MQKLIILRGIPASGKSTYAKKLVEESNGNMLRVNRDDLRTMLNNYDINENDEKLLKKLRDMMVREILLAGKSVVVDDTNISEKNINRLTQVVNEIKKNHFHEIAIEIIIFEISIEEAVIRDQRRENPVGEKVITSMYNSFNQKHTKHKSNYITQDQNLPHAIICDLDGTLALIDHRNPYDAASCEKDGLNVAVAQILKLLANDNVEIILLSGRMEKYRSQTENWLRSHNIKYQLLLMRKSNDVRKDSIIKKEIFENQLKGKYYIHFVLDDRNQVVDMWRKEIGLTCLQVEYGDF